MTKEGRGSGFGLCVQKTVHMSFRIKYYQETNEIAARKQLRPLLQYLAKHRLGEDEKGGDKLNYKDQTH